jgi:FkbM family methyltransferase
MHPVVARVRQLVRRTGFDVTRYPLPYSAGADPSAAYVRRIRELGADVVLDVGANTGQFALHLRWAGWEGRIVSYEPLTTAFGALSRNAAKDPQWQVFNLALGATKGSAPIHIAANSQSSSLLPMLETHRSAAPESAYVGEETVDIVPLDDALAGVVTESDRLCIKLDCQGYEGQVLDGASKSLEQTVMVIMELSLVDLYEGAMRFDEAVPRMRDEGFVLASIDPVFFDPETQQLLQVDGCFVALPRDGNGVAT